MTDPDLTAEQIRERVTEAQAIRRQGADQLHHRAAYVKPTKLTDAESAAIARAKIDRKDRP